MKTSRTQSVTEILIIILFFGIIITPLLGSFFHWDFYPYQGENRALAERPDIKETPIDELPTAIGKYYNDHFGFRNTFIRRYNRISKKILKQSSTVVEGNDSWLFLDSTVKDYMGFRRYSEQEANKLGEIITERQQWLRKQNIPYLLLIPPDKIRVYPNKLAGAKPTEGAVSRLQQVHARLQKEEKSDILYLLDTLNKAKKNRVIYLSNDTHWNRHGVYIGYREIIKRMQSWRPDLQPIALEDCIKKTGTHHGDLPRLFGREGKYDIQIQSFTPPDDDNLAQSDFPVGPKKSWHTWPTNVRPPYIISNPKGKGRVLVFHDSFGASMKSFLPHHFEQTAFFWIYSSMESLQDLVEEFKPDYIIEIQLERRIECLLDS